LISKAFSTHPPTPDRIKHSQEEMQRILPPRPEYVVSTSEFQDVKARLARLENRRKIQDDNGDGKKPTLRRTATTTGSGSGSGSGSDSGSQSGTTTSDDPPTLHRRCD
jgi:hypothetical protein